MFIIRYYKKIYKIVTELYKMYSEFKFKNKFWFIAFNNLTQSHNFKNIFYNL